MAATDSGVELGAMAGQVEAWFQTVTDIASGSSADIISPIDFVAPTMIEGQGGSRDIARQAAVSIGPRKDVIAAAIAAGQAQMVANRKDHCDMSIPEAKKPPPPPGMVQRLKDYMKGNPVYVPKKPNMARQPDFIRYFQMLVLAVMVFSGIVLTHMTLVKLGQPSPLDAAVHHGKHLVHMVRGKHHNKHAKCEEWAAIGGCAKNPVFMKEMCRKACYHAPAFDEVLVDSNSHCSDWSSKGECLNNPKFMMMHCPQSCSEADKAHEAQEAELKAKAQQEEEEKKAAHAQAHIDHNEALIVAAAQQNAQHAPPAVTHIKENKFCGYWSKQGECASNPSFMLKECPWSCRDHTERYRG